MSEIVPLVGYEVSWGAPVQTQIAMGRINSDAAKTRLADAAKTAVTHALESSDGVATVTITVRRISKEPTAVRFDR